MHSRPFPSAGAVAAAERLSIYTWGQ